PRRRHHLAVPVLPVILPGSIELKGLAPVAERIHGHLAVLEHLFERRWLRRLRGHLRVDRRLRRATATATNQTKTEESAHRGAEKSTHNADCMAAKTTPNDR